MYYRCLSLLMVRPSYEDINLTQNEFFNKLMTEAEVFTSQPLVGDVSKLWDEVFKRL